MLGLGRERVVRVPADGQGRMRADALPALDGPTIVCMQAGNVNTGAFDPVARDLPRGRARPARGSTSTARSACGPRLRRRTAISRPASSSRTRGRPTRTSGSTFPTTAASCSCATPRALRAAMAASAPRISPQGDERDPHQFTPEMSRRARGVEVWAALRSLGRAGSPS